MEDIEQKVKEYCDDIDVTLVETMVKYEYPEYRLLWEIFVLDTRAGVYYKHFNFHLVNEEIAVQLRAKVGLAIKTYTDLLREGK